MESEKELTTLWESIVSGVSKHYMRPNDHDAIEGNIACGVTHFTRHEKFWNIFLNEIARSHAQKDLSVLITAMSLGCEVYDAVRIAKTLGLDNLNFYGHDISKVFTERAFEGIYPAEKVSIVPDFEDWFEMDTPYTGFARTRPECFYNVGFLEPCDIRDLQGKFDIVVSTIMNPAPENLDFALVSKARHLAIESYSVLSMSEEFSDVGFAIFDKIGGCNSKSLKGNALPLQIPSLYSPAKSPELDPGL